LAEQRVDQRHIRYIANTDVHPIVFFDGECHFCDRSVQFIIRRDRQAVFRFASLQSDIAKSILDDEAVLSGHSSTETPGARHRTRSDSIVLLDRGQKFTQSTAVLRICKRMDGLWKLLYALIIVPKAVRDLFYRLFAANRYRLFGKQRACRLPSPDIRRRFLE
jgi:predicted DCC family thiol-disulfide oxidoreductase YuxK